MDEWVETLQGCDRHNMDAPGMDYARGGKVTQDEKPNEVTLLDEA